MVLGICYKKIHNNTHCFSLIWRTFCTTVIKYIQLIFLNIIYLVICLFVCSFKYLFTHLFIHSFIFISMYFSITVGSVVVFSATSVLITKCHCRRHPSRSASVITATHCYSIGTQPRNDVTPHSFTVHSGVVFEIYTE